MITVFQRDIVCHASDDSKLTITPVNSCPSGSEDFSKEVRTEFREDCDNTYDEYDPEEDEDSEKESDDARSISEEEQEDFCTYLMNTPS